MGPLSNVVEDGVAKEEVEEGKLDAARSAALADGAEDELVKLHADDDDVDDETEGAACPVAAVEDEEEEEEEGARRQNAKREPVLLPVVAERTGSPVCMGTPDAAPLLARGLV